MNSIPSETTIKQSQNEPLWQPSAEVRQAANLTHYMEWLKHEKGLDFDGALGRQSGLLYASLRGTQRRGDFR